jgi:RNA polymerase sigma-70 factor (ECF subfamily)
MSILATTTAAEDAMHQLREAIHRLPPEEKGVFLLRQNRELTYEQVAQMHHCSVAVVKERMRSALRRLRPVIQEVSAGYQNDSYDCPKKETK